MQDLGVPGRVGGGGGAWGFRVGGCRGRNIGAVIMQKSVVTNLDSV